MPDLTNDATFAAFIENAENKAKEEKERKSNGGFAPREYEHPEWLGLTDDKCKIFRIMGNPPVSMTCATNSSPFDAKEFYFSSIIDDSGKRIQLKLPVHADDPNDESIMWRIINAVKEVSWVPNTDPTPQPNGKKSKFTKVYKNTKYPWFDKVVKGGYDPVKQEFQYRISKGWSGQEVVVMNIIDRQDSWCKDNKHSKLLSKKIGTSKSDDGTVKEFPAIGVPSYGFLSELATICGQSGPWNKYDLACKRTGQMAKPYELYAATVLKKAGLSNYFDKDGTVAKYVSDAEDYTDEEKAYTMYDISKLFAPTTYNNIMKHLGNTIKAIDADLHRNFYEELKGLVEEEKKHFSELYGTEDHAAEGEVTEGESSPDLTSLTEDAIDPFSQPVAQPTNTTASTPVQAVETPTRVVTRGATAPQSAGLTPEKIALLKGWSKLTDADRKQIVDVTVNPDGTLAGIQYSADAAPLVDCPKESGGCGFPAPQTFLACPVCGVVFAS